MRRKILYTVLIFFAVVIILLVGVYFITQTQQFRDFARRTAESIVSSTTGQEFTIGSLEGNFFHNIKLKDVSFVVEGESFVSVNEVSLDYSIPEMLDGSLLFSKVIPIHDIIIEGLKVNLIKFENGEWNFTKIGKDEEKDEKKDNDKEKGFPDWTVILTQFLLTNGEINIDDRESGKLSKFTVPEIDFSINLIDIYRQIELDVKNADLYATSPELRVEGLSVKALYSEEKAQIDDLRVVIDGSEIKLNAKAEDLQTSPDFSFDAEVLDYEVENLGKMSVKTKGSGVYQDKKELNAEALIEIPESQIMGRKVEGGINKIEVKGSTLDISEGKITTELGEVLISGGGNLPGLISKEGSNDIKLDVSLVDVKTKEVFALLNEREETQPKGINTELGATLNSELTAEAEWIEFSDIKVKGDIEKLEIKGEEAGDLDLKGLVEYTKSALSLDISSNLNNVDLAQILDNNSLSSQLTSQLEIKAAVPLEGEFIQNLSAGVKGDIEPSSIFGLEIKSGELDLSLENQFLNVTALNINSDDFTLVAEGNQTGGQGVDFSYDLDVKDLGFVSSIVSGTEFSGTVKATGEVSGQITSPEVTIDLEASNITVKDGTGAEGLSLKGDGVIDPENLELNAELVAKKLNFINTPIESVDINAKSDSGNIEISADVIQNEKFKYEVDTVLSGLDTDEKKIEITDLKLFLEDTKLDNRDNITITLSPGQVIVNNFNLYYGQSSATGDANIDFDSGISTQVNIDNLSLDDLTNALQFTEPVEGTLSANISAEGTMQNPVLRADISTQGFGYKDFQNDISLNTSYASQNMSLKLLLTDGSQTIMDANGSANLDLNLTEVGNSLENGTLNLTISSQGVNLSPVSSLVGEIDKSEGTLVININASGNILDPTVNGDLKLEQATFKIKSLRNEFIFTDALIQMNGRGGSFSDVQITSNGGTGVFNGEINLSPLSYDISGTMDKFTVKPERISATLSGDIDVKGEGAKLDVKGKITVNRSRINIPDEPEKQIEDIQFVDEDEGEEIVIGTGEQTDFFQENVALALEVRMRNNNWIRGRGANVEIRGDLNINKKLAENVRIVGEIRTVRGTYENIGKLFRIQEGSVSFDGGTEINPFLDIRALYNVSDIQIFIDISGRAESPKINLSSNPAMSETDIVSYLVFGVSSSDLGSGERQSIQGAATGIAGGIAAQQLEQLLGPAVSLDVLSIDANQLEVGKYLTQDLYIAFQRASTESILESTNIVENLVLVEYQIFKNITIDAIIGGENPGADLFYNFNF